MPSKADAYRIKAEEAETKARRTKDPETKTAFLETARRWLEMAEMADKIRL